MVLFGDGTSTDRSRPVPVLDSSGTAFLTDIMSIEGGCFYSVALKSDGTVWSWGTNGSGVLGDGTTTNSYIPVQALHPSGTGYLTDIVSIYLKRQTYCCFKSRWHSVGVGQKWCWSTWRWNNN